MAMLLDLSRKDQGNIDGCFGDNHNSCSFSMFIFMKVGKIIKVQQRGAMGKTPIIKQLSRFTILIP